MGLVNRVNPQSGITIGMDIYGYIVIITTK